MKAQILQCPSCKSYGLSDACACGGKRVSPKPPRYSPEDKYGKYRRMVKEQEERVENSE